MVKHSNPSFKQLAILALLAALALVVAACGSSGGAAASLSITDHTPATSATGVLLADEIELTFSAAVDPASVTATTVKVLDGAQELSYTHTLSSDGKTLTLKLTSAPASLPANLTVQVEGVAGAAGGNASDSFSFTTADDWVELGSYVQEDGGNDGENPSIELDPDGHLVVALRYQASSSYAIAVRRWNGSAWENIGAPFTSGGADTPFSPDLELDAAGNPAVAWVEYNTTSNNNVFVRHWEGNQWVPYGSSDSALDLSLNDPASRPSLNLYGDGGVSIAFVEQSAYGGQTAYHVYHGGFNSNLGWVMVNTPDNQDTARDAQALDTAFDQTNGSMTLAWVEDSASGKGIYVKDIADGTILGGGPLKIADNDYIPNLKLALTSEGKPVVAWRELSNARGLFAKYYDGSAWQSFAGNGLVTSEAYALALVVDSHDRPVIATNSTDNNQLVVWHWDGTAWQSYAKEINANPGYDLYGFDIAVDANDNPIVVWSEEDEVGNIMMYAKRYNGLGK